MQRLRFLAVILIAFAVGAGWGVTLAKKNKIQISPAHYQGKSAEEAGAALIETAKQIAAGDSWKTIYVGRAYMLSGDASAGQVLFDSIGTLTDGDLIRMGRVYYQAGNWERAKWAFDQVVKMAPRDEDWLAEIGAYYNLQGEREHAEELFTRSFAIDSEKFKTALTAGASYLGVTPHGR